MPTKLGYQLDVDGQTLADCNLPCAGDNGIRVRGQRVPQQEEALDRQLPREYAYKNYTAPDKQICLQRR